MRPLIFALVLLSGPAARLTLAEQNGCCQGCGHHCGLKPVCRLVCETKTKVEICYDCRCEDFCVMGPSKKCGEVCEPDPCGCGHPHKWTLWKPCCGHVRHRHVLLKREVPHEVPHYKCVVEYVCPGCCCQCGRLPCDQANQLHAQAEALNAAAEKQLPVDSTPAEPQAVVASAPAKRSLFWPVLFGK